ncbi:hypothetical protein Tco_0808262 [Tanacetum coccineum]
MRNYRNLRIVLRSEGKLAHLEQPLILLPYHVASQAARDAYIALYDAVNRNCLKQLKHSTLVNRRKAVSKLLSLKDQELLGHIGMPRLCYAK